MTTTTSVSLEEAIQQKVSGLNESLNTILENEAVSEKELIKQQEIKYENGYVKYSTVFGKPFSTIDHAIKVFEPEDWDESVRQFIPEINPNYLPNKENLEKLVVGIMQHDKIFIHGATGSGKSSLVEYVCAKLRMPFVRINFSGDMESSALFGEHTVEFDENGNGTVVYKEGPLVELAKHGGVLCCDEFSTAPPEVAMAMQWPLEDNGKVYLKDKAGTSEDKLIDPYEWFTIVATDNTELQGDISGKHAGTSVQNTALLDRFQLTIKQDYLPQNKEASIMKKLAPNIDRKLLNKMVKVGSMIKEAYSKDNMSLTMSQRTLNNWAIKTQYWGDPVYAFKDAYFNKLIEDDRRVVAEFVFKVFGEEIK